MRRHAIVGRFGVGDRTKIPIPKDETPTRLDFASGPSLIDSSSVLNYGIGRTLDDLKKLELFPTEIGVDLLVLAAHVHAADTRISRSTESQDSWTREIRLIVPVKDPALWSGATTVLVRMLNFLTGDMWHVEFRNRPRKFAEIVTKHLQPLIHPPFDSIDLFSGGLDSLIGAIDVLESGGVPLLASHAAEGATSEAQTTCFDALKKHYKVRLFDRLRLWMSFPEGIVRDVGQEDTTRGRSFLFIALGCMAGTALKDPFKLRVPENGLIALNVPLDPLRLGALSTRTCHPYYIARWNELLVHVGIGGKIENPYLHKTKGEMIANCANKVLLNSLIPNSLSCSSPTKGRWQGRGIEHCGYCVPCLIRRAALNTGLRQPDPTTYTVANLGARVLDTRRSEGQQVRSFQVMIERLRASPRIAEFLIHKPGPLGDVSEAGRQALTNVYRRGMKEVGTLLSGVRTQPLHQ